MGLPRILLRIRSFSAGDGDPLRRVPTRLPAFLISRKHPPLYFCALSDDLATCRLRHRICALFLQAAKDGAGNSGPRLLSTGCSFRRKYLIRFLLGAANVGSVDCRRQVLGGT